MIKASVFYPGEGMFDHGYYINSHIPLLEKLMKPYGLVHVEVDRGIAGGGPGEAAPFAVMAHMVFDSIEDFEKASGAHDADLAADVKHFTDLEPIFQVSEIIR